MKKLKLLIWISVLVIIDSSLTQYISVFGISPTLVYAFLICTSVREEDFTTAVLAGGICGIFSGALVGQSFFLTFMCFCISAVAANLLRTHPAYLPKTAKSMIFCFIFSLPCAALLYLDGGIALTPKILYSVVLPSAIYNTAAAAVIYPLLGKTIYNRETAKKLIM